MKKILVIIVIIIIVAGISLLIYKFWPHKTNENSQMKSPQVEYSQVQIGGQEIHAEVADNEELRMKGLSGRESLGNNDGMLFVFEKPDIYPFWMKDMNFAVDIIWIKDKKIVDIVKDAEPPSVAGKTISYTPKAEADIVLETVAGFCEENGVKIGDEVQISKE
ncbi:MAG: DUF192 domain-containing protein [Candidatus Berkelbacteria bacterium]|nr:DUF192 domain-containing protein [Candidatus Berkelbacteria bacterium]